MEVLEVAWSGALERRGMVGGLSSYCGPSSLLHSPAYGPDILEPLPPGVVRRRAEDRKPRAKPGAHDADVVALLRKGLSYNMIARALRCSATVARSVARRHGLCRRAQSNYAGHRP